MLTPTRKVGIEQEKVPRIILKNRRLWRDVKFSLTYDGELLSASDKHTRIKNKNFIRFDLAAQLWEIYCFGDFERFQFDQDLSGDAGREIRGVGFVPLLTRKMNASCSLTIRLMRNSRPGEIVHGGDIDNRLKTLFDALRMPENDNEVLPDMVPKWMLEPDAMMSEPKPLCVCLLEDDSLITDLTVNTATIMRPLPKNHVRLVIDVEFRPFDFR